MFILFEDGLVADESWTVACDTRGCYSCLDPGEHDGPWTTQTAAHRAAESRGWWVWGHDYCPSCKSKPLGGGAA